MVAAREPGAEKRANTRPKSAACMRADVRTWSMVTKLRPVHLGFGDCRPYPMVAEVCTENHSACRYESTSVTQWIGEPQYARANAAYMLVYDATNINRKKYQRMLINVWYRSDRTYSASLSTTLRCSMVRPVRVIENRSNRGAIVLSN